MRLATLILAAGAARRMRGADKLDQDVGGQPLLTRIAQAAQGAGGPVYVALPGPDHSRAGLLPPGVLPVWVPDAANGMGASIRAGVAALPKGTQSVMILPADLPELTAQDLADLSAQYQGGILRATAQDGTPGHPVIFPATCFAELQGLTGDDGARSVLSAHPDLLSYHPLPGRRAVTDLDTPEAWAAWRAAQSD